MFQFNASQTPSSNAAAALTFGTPAISTMSSAAQQSSSTTISVVGLGGSTSTASNLARENREMDENKIMTPMLTPLPAEISHLVENFKNFLKTQLNLSESILSECYDSENGTKFEEKLRKLATDIQGQNRKLEIYGRNSQDLKSESRKDLRSAETALRLIESPNSGYTQYGYTVLMNFLTNAAVASEEKLTNLTRQIQIYENLLIARKLGSNSTAANLRDILLNIKFLDSEIKKISSTVSNLRSNVEDLKEIFCNHRRRYFNDDLNYFPAANPAPLAPPTNPAGPNSLRQCPSTAGALLEMAKALSRTSKSPFFGEGPSRVENASNFSLTKSSAAAQQPKINQWNLGATPSSSFSIGQQQPQPQSTPTVGVARPSFIASATDQQSSKRNKTGFFKET